MTARSRHPRRTPAALARMGIVAAALLAVVACSGGGGDDAGNDPVPTLLTAPIQPGSTTTTSTQPADGSDGTGADTTPVPTTSVAGEQSTTAGVDATDDTAATSSGPSAASTSSTAAQGTGTAATNPAASSTSSTADIEPPPSTPPPTAPVPTAGQPPDTLGGDELDFALAPRSIAGLQFGASRTTVLNRMSTLLGDPTNVTELPDCPGGPATGYQWYNLGVIVSDRGLAFYNVGMDLDSYGELPIPNWRTAAGIVVGSTQADLDAAYPGQITYGTPTGLAVPFTVSGGTDAGLAGQLYNGVLQSLSAGTTTC